MTVYWEGFYWTAGVLTVILILVVGTMVLWPLVERVFGRWVSYWQENGDG